MENTVKKLEEQVKETDETLGSIATKVGNVQKEICREGTKIEVNKLLQSVHDVKNDYQNLRKEISEVQDLQKQLSYCKKSTHTYD
ncbi:uncharacterized protein LOC108735886 isoform X2 [Agrilus planipennis]|uniref:Uncharacterized protein LOC108735886 isoform X2 n=1 Tax=Agrilus planipennis TaxID=224129 RepID=A0A1W4WI24_AGRPL|nr:uncharacterized protein LOC108735886 isoform X2 [Agrilus planipennis]